MMAVSANDSIFLSSFLQKLAIFDIYHFFTPFVRLHGWRFLYFFSLCDVRNKAVFLLLEQKNFRKHEVLVYKACVRYFLSNFYFFIKWHALKNYEKYFLFHLKSSFHSPDIQIFVYFPLPFLTVQIQKGKWKWNNLWCHKLACINFQM